LEHVGRSGGPDIVDQVAGDDRDRLRDLDQLLVRFETRRRIGGDVTLALGGGDFELRQRHHLLFVGTGGAGWVGLSRQGDRGSEKRRTRR
jgi:hypothetical protein